MYKQKSLAINYLFNLIKTLCGVLFPVITFSYASRVLGVEGLGKINFSKSFVSYFIMIAMMGINQYGTREAAKVRDNRESLSQFAQEVLLINLISTIFAYCLFGFSMLISVKLRNYTLLLLINSISIFLSSLGIEWLYQALEEYRYIAIRTVLFQILSLFLMFVFVKTRDDVVTYCIINVLSSHGSLVLNFIHAKKYVDIWPLKIRELKKHISPMLWLFAMAVSIELYTVLDTTMLGFLKGDTEVGLYTAAIKVNRMINTVIMAIGVVLIPRLSYYVGNKEKNKLNSLVHKGYNYVFLVSIPASIGLYILSDDIIKLFSGPEFAAAGLTMRIITPIVILIPFSAMTNQQTLVPLGKERLILISTLTGAFVNIICNALLIPRFAQNGAAIGTIVAELSVATVCFMNVKRFFCLKDIFGCYYQYWIATIPVLIIGVIMQQTIVDYVLRIVITVIISIMCYVFVLWMFKNQYFADMVYRMTKKNI